MKLVLLGPQGCGKGTQGRLLSKLLEVPHISTGDLLREIAASGSEQGNKLATIMQTGALVDDKFLEELLEERLSRPDCRKGFILDGTPRDLEQAEMLSEFIEIDKAILIDISEEESLRRVMHRHITEHRADDTKDALKKRLRTYHEKTEPVLDFFDKKGKLVRIDGMCSVHEVFDKIKQQLKLA